MKCLEVVLKTVETCNLNCSYCYFYVHTSLEDRKISKFNKKIISSEVINDLVIFLKAGIKELSLEKLSIAFHGGEPLLQNKEQFNNMCRLFTDELAPIVDLYLVVQTNGICINNQWLELFEEHNVDLGISIDGPEKYNDIYRRNFSGLGSHAAVEKAIRKAQEFFNKRNLRQLHTITVINANSSAKEIFDYLAQDLKVKSMSFLLPDLDYNKYLNDRQAFDSEVFRYGKFMVELFDAWIANDDPSINIPYFKKLVKFLIMYKIKLSEDDVPSTGLFNSMPIITVYHDGKIGPADDYITRGVRHCENSTLSNTSLEGFMHSAKFKRLRKYETQAPKECLSCEWLNVCGGGTVSHRYTDENGFDNPSLYCKALIMLHSHVLSEIRSGAL